MRFFLSPFIFVFELIGFLLSAAFVYALALMVAVSIIWYGISTLPPNPERIVEYIEIEPKIESDGRVCKRIAGCKVFSNAKTPEKYCPTCVWEKGFPKKPNTSIMQPPADPPPAGTRYL